MENKNQMQIGTWDKIETGTYEKLEKIKFEVNIPQKVVILVDKPRECVGQDGGVFYVFEVEQNGVKKAIQTSAWTLLKEIKTINLKVGMVLEIVKKLEKGKQFFEVKEVK